MTNILSASRAEERLESEKQEMRRVEATAEMIWRGVPSMAVTFPFDSLSIYDIV